MGTLRSFTKVAAMAGWFALCLNVSANSASARHAVLPTALPSISVGGERVRGQPILVHGRVLVPVRGVFEAFHADVQYSPPHFVVVRKDGAVIAGLRIDHKHVILGGVPRNLDVAPVRLNGRIYVPLRFVAEAAGASVTYGGHPPNVRIWPQFRRRNPAFAPVVVPTAVASVPEAGPTVAPPWAYMLVGLFFVGLLVEVVRRILPPRPAAEPAPADGPDLAGPGVPDASIALVLGGEARLRKEIVTEIRTIEVPVSREELVIEYAGEGGTVLVDGRPLASGEIVRIPLSEESIDIRTRRALRKDIAAANRASTT